jgi:DNA-cytosine methyltransferase
MIVISLFDGISCARVALGNLGIPCEYFRSEVDKHANAIAKYNWRNSLDLGDVRDVKNIDVPLGDVDLIIGGSPCQDLSVAGKRAGLSGDRSGLFYEYVRLVNEIRPKYFILENVYSMSKENMAEMAKALFLNDEWECIDNKKPSC